ncbi:hypothetical protein LOAG_00546 [Loa loa]|uniref:Uncharacterized protein n=1 Tax=Loa loa TaxID=7209 RepID=A0A1S0UB88_LOALO|nr:hypothetical protein LOAG_00546 [Loa loa]EFO27932.1 hypothetical protein LOAG_00546 [Loa loa]
MRPEKIKQIINASDFLTEFELILNADQNIYGNAEERKRQFNRVKLVIDLRMRQCLSMYDRMRRNIEWRLKIYKYPSPKIVFEITHSQAERIFEPARFLQRQSALCIVFRGRVRGDFGGVGWDQRNDFLYSGYTEEVDGNGSNLSLHQEKSRVIEFNDRSV